MVLVKVEKVIVIVKGVHVGLVLINYKFIFFVLDFLCFCLRGLGVVVV